MEYEKLPQISAEIEGITLLFDPRTVARVKSNNPALILYDLLLRSDYKITASTTESICSWADHLDKKCIGMNALIITN